MLGFSMSVELDTKPPVYHAQITQVESQGQMHKLTSGSSIQDKTHYDIISLHTSKHPEHSKCSYMHTMW